MLSSYTPFPCHGCMLLFLFQAGSSLGLFFRKRGGCDKSELLIIAWDEGRRDEGRGDKKPMGNVLNMVFVWKDDGTKDDGTRNPMISVKNV